MPQSYIEYSSGLTATTFSVPFKYLNIDNVNAIGTDGTNWTPLTIASRSASANTITLASAPSAFQAIRVYRQSAVTQLVDFQAGARLTESELDTAYNQGLFVAQEVSEDANKNQYTNFNEAALLANTSLSAFHSSTHTGDNSTVTFNLSFTPQTTIPQGYLVIVDGVLQSPVDAYTISIAPAQITFTSAPPTGASIVVTTAAAATGTLVEDTDLRAGINISPTPPAIPKAGELWFDSSIMTMFAYYDDGDGSPQWVSISSSVASNTGSLVANVKDFGAVGDGTTDDTAAIQAAISSGSSLVFIPSGTYSISKIIVSSPLRLVGESSNLSNGTILVPNDSGQTSSNTMVSIESDDVSIEHIGFNLVASPNPSNASLPQGTPYYAVRALEKTENVGHARLNFKNLHFDKGRNQLKLENSEDVRVENCLFENTNNGWACASRAGKRQVYTKVTSRNNRTADVSAGGGDGIKISTDPDTYVDDIKILDCTLIGNSRDGIDINLGSGRNIIISNNVIENNDLTGIEVKKGIQSNLSGTDSEYQDLIISDNIIKMISQLQVCINCQNSFDSTDVYRGINIFNNHLEYINTDGSSTDPAIKLEGITKGYVSSNNLINARVGIGARDLGGGSVISGNLINAWYGIQLQNAGVSDLTIKDNVIKATVRGIDFNEGDNVYINNNQITASSATPSSESAYGIFLGVGRYADILNNQITSTNYGIRIDDTYTGDVLISKNEISCSTVGAITTTYAIFIDSGSNYVIDDNHIITDSYGIRLGDAAGNEYLIARNYFKVGTYNPVLLSSSFTGVGVRVMDNNGTIATSQEFVKNDSSGGFRAYNNLRGDDTVTPTMTASKGDVIYNSNPTAGSYSRWIFTSGGAWKGLGLIQS